MSIADKVYDSIRENHLIRKGDFVIVGVSGGADSAALLHILSRWRKKVGFFLMAVHVHHGLRGEEADKDAGFVRDFCKKMKVDSIQANIDLKKRANRERMGIEEAGRKYRYMIFDWIKEEFLSNPTDFEDFSYKNIEERWKEKNKDIPISLWENSIKGKRFVRTDIPKQQRKVRIALAHHKDDQAETILFHLIRGSGLRGCSGMQMQRADIIRPMLEISRAEIEEYCREEKLGYCIDSTNRDAVYTRNILRNEILPAIRSKINPMVTDHIVRAGGLFFEADEFLSQTASEIFERHADAKEGSVRMPVEVLREKPGILRKYLIRFMITKLLAEQNLGFRDIHFQHIADVEKLLNLKTSARMDLPFGIFAKRDYADIIVSLRKENLHRKGLGRFVSRVFPYDKHAGIPKDGDIRWFDYDRLKGVLVLRRREVGDYLYIRGVGKKSLKSFMIDKKINREMRDDVALIACDHHIVWVIGYRTSDAFRVDEHTKQILEIQYVKEKEDGLSY